jgi:hypothetical protein
MHILALKLSERRFSLAKTLNEKFTQEDEASARMREEEAEQTCVSREENVFRFPR